MKNFKRVLVVCLLLAIAVAAYFVFGTYSEGYRAGTVIKLSHKGMLLKTFEGELNLGMVLNDPQPGGSSTEISNVWAFSVPRADTATIAALEAAMLSGKRSKLHYEQKFIRLPWRGETEYLVTAVETLP